MLFRGYKSKHMHARKMDILKQQFAQTAIRTQWGPGTNVLNALLDNRNQLVLGIFYFSEIASTLITALSKIICRLNKM